ncbi:elongator complex protein 5-like [Sycon ciliatum]|uniref:elongator complex protein 5-like n=1 Tax=Sycon ciliatum TaxID=27933 RepID=UPI0031F6223C
MFVCLSFCLHSRQPVADRNGSQVIQLPSADVAHLEEAITGNVTSCDGHRSVVIVDALSCLLRGGQSVSACCRVLKRLSTIGTATTGTSTGQSGSTDSSSNASTSSGTNTSGGGSGGVRVFVLLHGDLHSESVLAQLRHISNSVFSLSAPPTGSYQVKKFSSSVAAQDVTSVCDMTHRRVSGKITKETCLLAISSTLQLHTRVFDANAEDDTTAATATAPGSTAPDPTANLTFNLRLTSKEKEARSNVVLPYTQVQKRDRSVAGGPSSGQLGAAGGGQIYYQPDDADDFDEEDPDDDLDI